MYAICYLYASQLRSGGEGPLLVGTMTHLSQFIVFEGFYDLYFCQSWALLPISKNTEMILLLPITTSEVFQIFHYRFYFRD